MAVGNHDIEQGVATYRRAERESNFPWLSANAVLPDGTTYFLPYTIIEKMGLKNRHSRTFDYRNSDLP